MNEALQMVLAVKQRLPQVTAADPHHLVSCNDARNMALSAELFYRTALTRKESRGWFIREDYPERDDAACLKWINAVAAETAEHAHLDRGRTHRHLPGQAVRPRAASHDGGDDPWRTFAS